MRPRSRTARRGCLTVVVIGGGLVGIELLGELTAFADDVLRFYPRLRRDEIRFLLFEAGARILPEIDEELAGRGNPACFRAAAPTSVSRRQSARSRPLVCRSQTRRSTRARLCSRQASCRASSRRAIPVAHDPAWPDRRRRDDAEPQPSESVWALGDCAAIPGPDGRPYPALAQHTVREARHLARNIQAVIEGRVPTPFVFQPLGTMASLGHTRAVARVFGVRLTGFPAWWIRRTYYLFQMPRWDRRLRIVLDWTVALFFRPDITKVELRVEREQVRGAPANAGRRPSTEPDTMRHE